MSTSFETKGNLTEDQLVQMIGQFDGDLSLKLRDESMTQRVIKALSDKVNKKKRNEWLEGFAYGVVGALSGVGLFLHFKKK